MHTFEQAAARTHRHAGCLLHCGYTPDVVHDALITEGISLWAAATGNEPAARFLINAWAAIRDAAEAEARG